MTHCLCGCGQETALAPQTHKGKGWVKGQPLKYVRGHARRRISDENVIAAYAETGNIWRAGEVLGCCGQTVQVRLRKLGVDRKDLNEMTEAEERCIREFYLENRGAMDLGDLASSLGRPKTTVSRWAREMGLTRRDRPSTPETKEKMSSSQKESLEGREHPRGALGMRHTDEFKAQQSARTQEYWANVTEAQLQARYKKAVATRQANGTPWSNNGGGGGYRHCKRGFREDIGIFVRSAWEANWARFLNFLVTNSSDPLLRWEYEPDTFWFEPIKRGTVSYTPDFKLFERGREPYYQELKGRMDDKSKTKLKRMAKYHPAVRVDLIDAKAYREVERKLSAAIPGWEFGS